MGRYLAAVVLLSLLLGASSSAAADGVLRNGTVSQRHRTVALGSTGVCGLYWRLHPSPCSLPFFTYGSGDGDLPVHTPGAVHVHMIAPVLFIAAAALTPSNPSHNGARTTIEQASATEANITFHGHLHTGEVVRITASYEGESDGYFFRPIERKGA
jgi:hypothetical protein